MSIFAVVVGGGGRGGKVKSFKGIPVLGVKGNTLMRKTAEYRKVTV